MASKKAPISPSDFIRSQPMNLSAAKVIAKAKAAGLKLTSKLVHQVRDSAKAADAAKKETAAEKKVSVSTTKASATSNVPKRKNLPVKTAAKKAVKQATAAGRKLASVVKDVRATTMGATAKRKSTAAVPGTPAPIPIGDADVTLASPKPRASASHDEIAKAAYLRWLSRGKPDGTDLEDWSAAERDLGVLRRS
jgi:hypothetical protein